MPQMAPLSWTSLLVYFSVLLMISVAINYYIFSYKPKTSTPKAQKSLINWKW
uniref:ATP synthase complex subunit 8 n=1 Tax=Gnathotrichus materiarius TaxID=1220286 RepID=A0A343A6M6_9CUCU|nr:ATP synthase F0 subunit 8 [Gnathotrichus materiarius]AOY40231.1 ATP synthase F0 subunit 8 [Gnathotrichus materiarius]